MADGYYMKLAQIESGGNPLARNPNSSAKGMFQFIDDTAKQYGITAPFGTPEYAKQEIDAVQKFTQDNFNTLKSGLGREPTEGELYLAHQQGAKGALNILSNLDKKAVDVVGEQQVLLNAGNADMTAQDFANQWVSKFDEPKEEVKSETFSVKLPDGTLLKGIPLGTTKEQIKAKLQAGGYNVSKLEEPEQVEVETPEPRQAGFVQRVSEDLSDRLGNVGESYKATVSGQQKFPELVFQSTGQALGGLGDVLGNALISGYRSLPDVEYGIEEALGTIGSIPTGGDSDVASSLGQGIDYLTGKYREFAKESPRAARNVEALGNIGAAFVPVKGLNVAGKAGVATGRTVKEVSDLVTGLIPQAKNISSQVLRQEAGKAYALADELGGVLKPKVTDNIFKNITSEISLEGATLPAKTQAALRKVADPEGIIRQATDVFETLKGKPLTLEGFKTIDQTLGDLAYKASTPDDVARKVLIMQRQLRNAVDNIKPADLVGSNEAFNVYKNARELWSKQAKIRDLENITAKAFATDQPTNALKRALKRFTADERNLKGFSEIEIKAINEAAETGVVGNLVRSVTGRLPSSISMATNPALTPALSAASTVSRGLSDDIMLKRMQGINNLIATGQKTKLNPVLNVVDKSAQGLGSVGSLIEKAYSGNKGNLATLGTIEQMLRERERERSNLNY